MVDQQVLFLIDRSLGAIQVPRGLREAGWSVITLAEHYGARPAERVSDEDWLTEAGRHGWAVLMKDARIRYRTAEREALLRAGINAFCLAGADRSAAQMIQLLLRYQEPIMATCRAGPGPSLWIVTSQGLREATLG